MEPSRLTTNTMMLPTHALGGMLLALPVALAMPEHADVALVAGLLGGVVPDLDLYAGHRKTLHFPVYFSAGGAAAVALALAVPSAPTVAAAVFLLAAALHCVADAFGSGLELRPWEATSERAVYDHHRGRWIAPRRWVRYDGAPEDFVLSALLAVPLLVAVDGPLRWVVPAALAVAAVYAAVRRLLPAAAVTLATRLPDALLLRLPVRYRDGDHGRTPSGD